MRLGHERTVTGRVVDGVSKYGITIVTAQSEPELVALHGAGSLRIKGGLCPAAVIASRSPAARFLQASLNGASLSGSLLLRSLLLACFLLACFLLACFLLACFLLAYSLSTPVRDAGGILRPALDIASRRTLRPAGSPSIQFAG